MIVGFTGTRRGMTDAQKETFTGILFELGLIDSFHHGDCQGADDEAADICYQHNLLTVTVHPPVDETHRAWNAHHDTMLLPKTHFARNRDIVNVCDVLIACPYETSHQDRGGSWYTVDYAKKQGKQTIIIWPDGRTE